MWLPLLSGCFGGSLATSTGSRSSGDWSIAGHQAAHVGEKVRFSFVLTQPFITHPISPAGIADYCIVALDDQNAEAEPDANGKFTLAYRMPEAWRNREIRVRATAYRQYGQPDRKVVGGELLQVESAADPVDRVIARAALTLLVYHSTVELTLTPGADDFDFSTGRLVLRKADGTGSSVGMARPPVGGFTVEGPDALRVYTVRFAPAWEQVNLTGTTAAEFTVLDLTGVQHRFETEFLTP
ncbi:MAG: hypothetical protein V2A79_11175 [Planctomycetota bacterium]